MVKVRITDADDIITAYLVGLGYKQDQASKAVAKIRSYVKKDLDSDDNIVKLLDDVILKKAKTTFNLRGEVKDEQVIAMFKLAFILSNGADYYTFDGDISKDLVKKMQENIYITAPHYKLSNMKAQTIEISAPKTLLRRMFRWLGISYGK